MKPSNWIGPGLALLAATGFLAACHRPVMKDPAQQAASAPTPIGVERPGPVAWDAKAGGFTLAGKPLKAAKLWTFDGSTDGFTAVGSKLGPAAGQGLSVTVADPTIRSPKGLATPGGQYSLVLVRLTRTAAASLWDGALYYSTVGGHGEMSDYHAKPLAGADPKVGETTTLVYDMSHQAKGGPDWTASTIDQIRFDLEDRAGGGFVIRQIAITENPDPAALGPQPATSQAAAPSTAGAQPTTPPAKP